MLHTLRGLLRKRVLAGLVSAGVLIAAPFALADIISGNVSVASSSQVTITRLTVGTPTSTVAGDVLIANIAINKGNAADVLSVPSGWNQIARTDNDANVSIVSYWKKADASDQSGTTYEWDINNQTQAEGGITAYSGVDSAAPIDTVASSTGFSSTATAPSVTTSFANDEVISLFATDFGKNANTQYFGSTGWSQKYNSPNTPYGPSIAAFDTMQATAGPSGDLSSAINSNKPHNWVAQQIALKRPVFIAYDSGSGVGTSGTDDLTMPVTLSADDDFLVVGVGNGNNAGDTVTGVTWNGTPMVPLGKVGETGTYGYYTYLYGLMNPAPGTRNVVTQGASSAPTVLLAAGYTHVKELPTNVQPYYDYSYVSSISDSITTSAANAWVIGFGAQNSGCSNSWTGLVSRADDGCAARSLGDTNGPVSPGSHTFTWSGPVSSNWKLILMEVDPIQ